MVLRNIAPREGTETCLKYLIKHLFSYIKKYSSPRGDGNSSSELLTETLMPIKKYSSPRGDGNGTLNP